MRQADPMRFGDETEERAVTVEAPGAGALLYHFKAWLVVAVEKVLLATVSVPE